MALFMKLKNTIKWNWSRDIKVALLFFLSFLLFGCGSFDKKQIPKNSHFLFITPNSEATFESLAEDYLGDARLVSRIKEFNGLDRLVANQEIIIPLQSFRPGGLTAKGYQLVPVLAYHHFSQSNSNKKMIVGASKFDQQLRHLKSNGYYGISLDQFFDYLNFGQVPEKSVVITIDDGWASAYSIAYPLLKKHDYPAVLYIQTNNIREREGRFLNWTQLRSMLADETVDIQPHTKTHRDLTKQYQEESFSSYIRAIRFEMAGAKHAISKNLGYSTTSLAYPYGATNSFVSALAKVEGYTTGFTVRRKGNPFFLNNFELNRAMIYGGYNERQFAKNIKTFEPLILEKSEPIDESLNMAQLNYQNPETYENKDQWRTAFMAWKIHRDWLVSGLNHNATTNRSRVIEQIEQADNQIIVLSEKLKKIAGEHYRSAMATSKKDAHFKGLLLTLLYDPRHEEALRNLKLLDKKTEMLEYLVKAGDTSKKIAKLVYGNERKEILIPVFNARVKDDSDLTPGMVLKLPKRPKTQIVNQSKRVNNSRCGLSDSSKSNKELSAEYYASAIQQFNNGNTSQAISSLKTSLCFDPANHEAEEMQSLLEDL